MINMVFFHPLFCTLASVFGVVVLPQPVAIWVVFLNKLQQIPLQNCLEPNAFHASTEDTYLSGSFVGNTSPNMNLKNKKYSKTQYCKGFQYTKSDI